MLNKKFDVKQIGEQRVLNLYIYGEVRASYTDWWGDYHESKTSAEYIINAINTAGAFDLVNVYINSIGGSVSEGIAIYNNLKRIDKPIHVYIDAFAYSIASVIAMAGDKIVMPSNTTMMIHNAMMSCFGNAADLRKAADDLDVINEASCNSYLVKSKKIDKDKLVELLDAETFLGAEQALEYGLCDEIANPVDLSESIEIAEQAARNKNPYAEKAIEQINQTQKKEPKNTKTPEPPKDKFDLFAEFLEKRRKGE